MSLLPSAEASNPDDANPESLNDEVDLEELLSKLANAAIENTSVEFCGELGENGFVSAEMCVNASLNEGVGVEAGFCNPLLQSLGFDACVNVDLDGIVKSLKGDDENGPEEGSQNRNDESNNVENAEGGQNENDSAEGGQSIDEDNEGAPSSESTDMSPETDGVTNSTEQFGICDPTIQSASVDAAVGGEAQPPTTNQDDSATTPNEIQESSSFPAETQSSWEESQQRLSNIYNELDNEAAVGNNEIVDGNGEQQLSSSSTSWQQTLQRISDSSNELGSTENDYGGCDNNDVANYSEAATAEDFDVDGDGGGGDGGGE